MTRLVNQAIRTLRDLLARETDRSLLAVGKAEARAVRAATYDRLQDAEFRVFSQWGEDGIIQYLLSKTHVAHSTFVEFGVEDYSESNTRFLLCNDNWRGLIIDGGTSHIHFARQAGLEWRHSLTAVSAFVTAENINALLKRAGFFGDIGLLSVDIDGNDYWVWRAIDVARPAIVIVEYNSVFGPLHSVTIPYDPAFCRTRAHYSHLYYGASLAALCTLGQSKGYAFVGSNSAGSNAFFVRRDMLGGVRELSAEEGYVESRFRESRDKAGQLSLITDHRTRLEAIADLPLVDPVTNTRTTISELYGV